jgi:EAL domain-containing protein (putative c-di-GMP-specific phosphodiesterase class I)
MKNVNINIDMMKELSEIGIRISIDDFGTGYSSFNYLKHFPVDILKIDKSFIDDITNTDNDLAIVSAIISMAHSLNLKVVAEGVEEREQLDLLLDNKCDEIQGYYYSRPLPTDEFTDFVKKSMNQTLSTVDNN